MTLNVSLDFSAPTNVQIIMRSGVWAMLTVRVLKSGMPIDLTGASIRYVANTSTQIIKTVGSGIAIVAPATDGVFTITFASTDTSIHNVTNGFEHECKLQELGGEPLPVFEGSLMLEASLFTTV